jgi:acyl dehydratase
MTTAFERIAVGEARTLGAHTFTADEIKRFAAAWDPQRFHVDEDEARASTFGALAASGWHTASAMMRLLVDWFDHEDEAARARGEKPLTRGPSPGFDNLKWSRPVYAGDTVTYVATVTAKRHSKSRPGWGIISTDIAGMNQRGEAVFAVTTQAFARTDDA